MWAAQSDAGSRDPWTDLAALIADLLRPRGGGAAAVPAVRFGAEREPDVEVEPPVPQPESRPATQALAAGEAQPDVAAPELPASPEVRVLQQPPEEPEPGTVQVPEFPEGGVPLPGSEGAPAPGTRIPIQAATTAAAPAAPAPGAGSAGEVVGRWQAGVRQAGGGMPRVLVRVDPGERAELRRTAGTAQRRNTQAREGLTEDAVSNVPPAPDVGTTPAPPPRNPVPGHTARVLRLSGRRLPDQSAPALVASPERDVEHGVSVGGRPPRIGDRPVAPDLFQALVSPRARELARLPAAAGPGQRETPEQEQVRLALEMLSSTAKVSEQRGRGPQVITPDTGPVPMRPLPPAQRVPVGHVVARLLAQADETTEGVLDTLRTLAFRGGVLKTNFPEAGQEMSAGLGTQVGQELREIAAAADVSAADLEGMIADRRAELDRSAGAAADEARSEGEAATETVTEEGQETADAIDGAARAAEEETLHRQAAASGESDPAVINRRRDLTVAWIREQVTTQITDYQRAGERRERQLNTARQQQFDAYRAHVQREIYQVMTPVSPRPERDPSDTAREQRLADLSAAIRAWGADRVRIVSEAFRRRLSTAQKTTRTHRSEIETAGSAGIEAARVWAEDKILEGRSWWDRIVARINRWLSEASDVNEQWRVRRTQENRNAVAHDIQTVQMAREALDRGLTQDQILADRSLTDAQRSVLQAYFAQAPGTHPLDFAARRLRDNIARGHLERARQVFERELIAMPVSGGDFDTANKLDAVAAAQSGGFSAAQISQQLRAAMDQIGTDEAQIYGALRGLTPLQGAVVRKMYRARYNRDLDFDLRDELSGDELRQAQAQIEGRQSEADAIALHDAIAGWGTDEAAIMRLLRDKTPQEIEAIRAQYLQRYGETLDEALEGDLAEGNELDQANALIAGDVATADAIALDEAMRGGLTGWGTSEEEIEQVYTRTRSEVLALAQRESWTAEEMEAEVRRRLAAIERRFGERYRNVEQYNAPGLEGGTVLERAFSSELSGSQRHLAVALQNNDLIAADAARIEIERTGFYASDDAMNAVFRSQYERALQARRLDEGPARNMRVRRLVDDLRRQQPPLSEEEISRRRMALERQMEREMEDGAQADSRLSMDELRDVYQDRYVWPLSFVVETSMSGESRNMARNMLEQGGRLDPIQEVEYATRTVGTDEEALRRVLTRMTRAEIQALRDEWERRHPGRSFNAMLRSELTGRDASDIMDAVYHGAPESAEEQIAQEERRVRRELRDLTGVLGSSVAGNEAAWMENELDRLRELRAPLRRTDWPDTPEARREREQLAARVDERVSRVQDAVADHRRRIDSVTDAATQAIGIAVGVTVAVVLGAVSGGTLGVVTIALMASLMATASTITTKMLIKGGSYGIDDYGIDVAVGVVDAITAVATAGMGSRLLRPLQALVQRTRVGDVAGWVGRTGLAQRMARAPGAATVRGLAGRAGLSRTSIERGAAAFLAEGIEDAVGAAPSAFVQIALTDQTWQGDPLKNFLESGGMALLQAVAMGRMMAGGMAVGQRGFTGLRGMARSRTEVGRLLEANRIIQDGYGRFVQDNPGASIGDFLASPAGRDVRATIERRGLMPDIEAASRAAEVPAPSRAAEVEAPPTRADLEAEAQVRADALEGAIPEGLREGTFVSPDPELPGRTVRVEPLRIGNRIVGVDVRVGPDATPLDIAMHAATVHAMHRYRGTLGNIRRALADMAATITGSGLKVGSRGWEARLEMGKLPAIIAARMDGLAGRPLSPQAEARVMADIAGLEAQFHHHQAVFNDPALRGQPGRGYVAAEEGPPVPPPRAADLDFIPADRLRNADGTLSDEGRLDLEVRLDAARLNLEAARSVAEGGELPYLLEARRILARIEELHGVRVDEAWRHLADLDDAGTVAQMLVRPRPDLEEPELPGGPRMPPESGEAFMQRQIDEALQRRIDALREADPKRDISYDLASPAELVTRIGAGDPRAQAQLDTISAAPDRYTTEAYDADGLEALLGANRIGILRIGDASIQISRAPVTDDNPNPPFRFHGEFPPYSKIGDRVLQLEDGGLRIWRSPPTDDYPEGLLMQETIVGGSRDRAGHERIAQETYKEAGLTGPRTERAHVHGPGLGPESPFGILHAPARVNQEIQLAGIEAYLAALRDASPEGVTWHYVTEVRHQGQQVRLEEIVYKIEVTVDGHRMPFAEFAIRIDPLASGGDASAVTARDIVGVDPIEFRGSAARGYEDVLEGLRHMVDVPEPMRQVRLPERAQIEAVREALQQQPPAAVEAAAAAGRGTLAAHRPPPSATFDADTWRRGLERALWARPRPEFLVVDLRGLGLTEPQQAEVRAAINRQAWTGRRRVVVIE